VIFTLLPQGDYTVQADQTLLSFTGSGQQKIVTLTITPVNGFRSNMNLTTLNLPPGFTATFTPQTFQVQQALPITVLMTIVAGTNIQPGTYAVDIVTNTGVTATKTTVLTFLVQAGVGQIWPVVLVVVVVIAVVSLLAFVGLPKAREVRRIPERERRSDVPSLPP
jgi:Na+/phosphate symporter